MKEERQEAKREKWQKPECEEILLNRTKGGAFDLDKEDGTYHNTAS